MASRTTSSLHKWWLYFFCLLPLFDSILAYSFVDYSSIRGMRGSLFPCFLSVKEKNLYAFRGYFSQSSNFFSTGEGGNQCKIFPFSSIIQSKKLRTFDCGQISKTRPALHFCANNVNNNGSEKKNGTSNERFSNSSFIMVQEESWIENDNNPNENEGVRPESRNNFEGKNIEDRRKDILASKSIISGKKKSEKQSKTEPQKSTAHGKVSPYLTLPIIFPAYRIRQKNPLQPTRYDPYQYTSNFNTDTTIENEAISAPYRKPSKTLSFPKGCTLLFALDSSRMYFAEHGIPDPNLSARYLLGHALTLEEQEKQQQEKSGGKTEDPGKFKQHEDGWKSRDPWDMDTTKPMSDRAREIFLMLCSKRMERVPVQYLVGNWDFHDITIDLRPPVLIPRPETEEMVEELVNQIKKKQASKSESRADSKEIPLRILDIGCGSGAIGLSLLKQFPDATCVAIDINEEAVDLSIHNSKKLGLQERYLCFQSSIQQLDFLSSEFVENNLLSENGDQNIRTGDLEKLYRILLPKLWTGAKETESSTSLKSLLSSVNSNIAKTKNITQESLLQVLMTATELTPTFDIIVSNPPYIPRVDMFDLMSEVIEYEDYNALFGGDDDGGFIIKEILRKAPSLLDESSQYSWCWLETDSSHSECMEEWVALSSIENTLLKSSPSSAPLYPASTDSIVKANGRIAELIIENLVSDTDRKSKSSKNFDRYLALEKYYTDLSKNPRYCFLKMKRGLLLGNQNND